LIFQSRRGSPSPASGQTAAALHVLRKLAGQYRFVPLRLANEKGQARQDLPYPFAPGNSETTQWRVETTGGVSPSAMATIARSTAAGAAGAAGVVAPVSAVPARAKLHTRSNERWA
jgi:hypothetical protein